MSDELPVSVFDEVIDPKDKVSDVNLVPPEMRLDTDDDGSEETNALTTNEADRSVEEGGE